ncbi:MAG: bifunctional folylpolyglutamate synthase/dihydrofolate synthase [Anaerolineales bacterium]
MMTYQESLDFLYSFVDYGATRLVKYSPETFDLSRMRALLDLMGNPQDGYPTLHVAGTKGKGSVSALCAAALAAGGHRTGLYTSPHLLDFRERMQINGEYISEASIAAIVERLREFAPQVPGITTFELTTALAFEYFARAAVDVAVIEVGLGGRLDATNTLTPLVSVITSLSLDHMDLLGPTLTHIATEKAGILKPGVPVVSAPQPDEALAALETIAAERGAPLTLVGRDWFYRVTQHSVEGQTVEIKPAAGEPVVFDIPLLGRHQAENAATAYVALRASVLSISDDAVRAGFRAVRWPGRFEILQRHPYVIADGAHNRDSAHKLAATLDDYFPGQRIILIFGVSADKDVAGMLEVLVKRAGTVICTQAVHPRAMEPEQLADEVARAGAMRVEAVAPVAAALDRALQLASAGDMIVATGSLFVVAEVQAAHIVRAAIYDLKSETSTQ